MFLWGLGIPCVFPVLTATETSKKPSGSSPGDGKKASPG